MKTLVIKENQSNSIDVTVNVLKENEVVVCPTETVYGIATSAFNYNGIKKIFKLKNRKESKPLPIMVDSIKKIKPFIEEFSDIAKKLAEKFFPGPLTLIFKSSKLGSLITSTNTIGIRIPAYKFLLKVLKKLDMPVAITSANISNKGDLYTFKDVYKVFNNKVRLIINGGITKYRIPSTVIDVSFYPPLIVREGVIKKTEIFKTIGIK